MFSDSSEVASYLKKYISSSLSENRSIAEVVQQVVMQITTNHCYDSTYVPASTFMFIIEPLEPKGKISFDQEKAEAHIQALRLMYPEIPCLNLFTVEKQKEAMSYGFESIFEVASVVYGFTKGLQEARNYGHLTSGKGKLTLKNINSNFIFLSECYDFEKIKYLYETPLFKNCFKICDVIPVFERKELIREIKMIEYDATPSDEFSGPKTQYRRGHVDTEVTY